MQVSPRISGIAAVVGGLLWALVPLLDDIYPPYELVLWIIPLLLLGGAHGIHRQYNTSREEHRFLTLGFYFLTAAALLQAFSIITQGSIVFLAIIGIPAIIGVILVVVASAFIAYRFWNQDTFPRWIAVLFGVSLPLDPLVNALLAAVVSFGISLYGVSWMVIGLWLLMRSSNADSTRSVHETLPVIANDN